jgi:hypothetical protein
MPANFDEAYAALREIFVPVLPNLVISRDTDTEYTLVTHKPSPMPQHKGAPMFFGMVRKGKAYASFHLMPLYMHEELVAQISPELRKRMQGKTCFNFKAAPDAKQTAELRKLTKAGLAAFQKKKWA